eukprot:9024277-Pyramimonas_sp.AAC.1
MGVREEREGRCGTCHQTTPGAPKFIVDLEAFDVETCSGTARRSSQRLLASAAACKKQWVIASLDISMAFLKELAYQELAEAIGEKERVACCTPPPGSATVLRALPGFERYD